MPGVLPRHLDLHVPLIEPCNKSHFASSNITDKSRIGRRGVRHPALRAPRADYTHTHTHFWQNPSDRNHAAVRIQANRSRVRARDRTGRGRMTKHIPRTRTRTMERRGKSMRCSALETGSAQATAGLPAPFCVGSHSQHRLGPAMGLPSHPFLGAWHLDLGVSPRIWSQ